MVKEELIKFIEGNYAEGENLLWQIVSKENIEAYTSDEISEDKWDAFVDYTERYSVLADPFSQNSVEEYNEFEFEEDEE